MKAMIGDLQSQIDSRQAKQVAMVRKLLASAQNAEQPAGALLVEPVPLVTTNEDRAGLEQQLEQARAQLREASAREVALTEQLEAANADAERRPPTTAAAAAKAETVEAEAVVSALVATSRDGKADNRHPRYHCHPRPTTVASAIASANLGDTPTQPLIWPGLSFPLRP